MTKGSGSNGVDTVYQVGNPETLPTLATASSTPITILTGFPTVAAKTEANNLTNYPFGVWFANPTTLYVADEGQDSAPFDPADNPNAGLEKWTFDGSQWNLAYVLQNGLNIGTQYSVPNDAGGDVYPTSLDPAPAGLRALTGRLNGDGTATIWAVTSTTSTNTDQGADPNQLVMITDDVSAPGPSAPAGEAFSVVRTAQYGEVFRGVSFTPGTINPVETVSVAPPPNGSGWNNTDVTVTVTATLADPAVPVQSIVYSFTGAQSGTQTVPGSPAVATVSAEGDTTVSYYAQDAAGSRNATSTLPTPLMIDKTPPVIVFAGNAGSYTVDQTILITCTASDALSGLASDSCPGVSGPAYSFALGLHTLNASATDQAGNVANASASFTVSVTYGSLAKLTQQFVTNKPLIDGTLTLELDLASQAASKGLREIKDLAIQAYIDEVGAESGKFLTAAQAAILIQLAETLL